MNNFTFYSPTLFAFGDGEEQNTGALVRRFGGSKVLLVYGGGSVKRNGAYDAVTASLRQGHRLRRRLRRGLLGLLHREGQN